MAADNVINARIVDANGRLLNKRTMGKDLFWAIRGGGGGNFGIVVAWKIRLVSVPRNVTVFSVNRNLTQGVTNIVHRWQEVAHQLPPELVILVILTAANSAPKGEKTIVGTFSSMFLGDSKKLQKIMKESFPELGLESKDCTEMSWIQSVLFLDGMFLNGIPSSVDILLKRTKPKLFFKVKSDYVKKPIPQIGLEGLWERLFKEEQTMSVLVPYGGRMSEISETKIPYAHRDGNIFKIVYMGYWIREEEPSEKYINRVRRLYEYMTPYVSKSPREAYVNYRDLDLGKNKNGTTTYLKAKVWGEKYYKGNFNRLVHMKTKVDPDNFFRHEQTNMRTTSLRSFLLLLSSFAIFSNSLGSSSSPHVHFLKCISLHSNTSIPIYTPKNANYSSILQSKIGMLRFNSSTTPKPFLILTPLEESHVQTAVICSREHGIQIRVRSGGHDFEGLSYTSDVPFIIVDLFNLREVNVDVKGRVAWVQSGATTGELYYRIAQESNILAFPAAICTTVGIGGYISGGGYGAMLRKFGTAGDNVVDARIVDVHGKILNRKSMGEGLFWAIRGGGGGSFGVVLSWKLKLVSVPPSITVFSVDKTLAEGASSLVHKWQDIAHRLPQELIIFLSIGVVNATTKGEKTIRATFRSLFLGDAKKHKLVMKKKFPELGVENKDFIEMSWIQSVLFLDGLPINSSIDILGSRPQLKLYMKGKSDYVRQPISQSGLELIWDRLLNDKQTALVFMPYGGRMSEISESETPFPHRNGTLFHILYVASWNQKQAPTSEEYISRLRRMYKFMTPYVSKSPREAYANYRDLDLGKISKNGTATYAQAKVWGTKYFKGNFDRLVYVKTKVDPDNFFRTEQSIPIYMISFIFTTNLKQENMRTSLLLSVSILLPFFILFSESSATSSSTHGDFLKCVSLHSDTSIPIYTPKSANYSSILHSTISFIRFNTSITPKPFLILTPLKESHVQTAWGHDFEGLSYTSYVPFIIVDLFNLRKINVDVKGKVAWVQSGATTGELYYEISKKSNTLAFPAAIGTTVGFGGFISGGGYGAMFRKYGTAGDNVIDARIVDVHGRILNKKTMGEGLFWAIRGGGGGSFGIVLSWKIKLVSVPPTVTVFRVDKTLAEGALPLVHKWQDIAHRLPKELLIFFSLRVMNATTTGEKTIRASFRSLFLGDAKKLKMVMKTTFPELSARKAFIEMSWIQSVLFLDGLPFNSSIDILERLPQTKLNFKGKLDYVRQPISQTGLKLISKRLLNDEQNVLVFMPYGGRMSEISESETPFPHRNGTLFHIFYMASPNEKQVPTSEEYINQLRRMYKFMTPYVSKSREAYVNYRDLDLGKISKNGTATYAQAKVWGTKYFKGNFDRLVKVKTNVDPDNFFRTEQSIPSIAF
ncbi:hypothetical protein MKW92_007457 [Papaver armeniacum]|nr:hypothetical protein MKW92_007457 [Papaver armeniacum]